MTAPDDAAPTVSREDLPSMAPRRTKLPPDPWQTEAEALSSVSAMAPRARGRRRSGWLALPVMLIVGLVLGIGVSRFLNRDNGQGPEATHDGTSTASSSPTTEPSSTATRSTPTRPTRRCWDGSRTASRCAYPKANVTGMRAASPSFARALDSGACKPDSVTHTSGGFDCEVSTPGLGKATVHFAWYRTRTSLDRHFRKVYPPPCVPAATASLRICGASSQRDRVGLRYANRRMLFAVTVSKSAGGEAVLNALDLIPLNRLRAGTP